RERREQRRGVVAFREEQRREERRERGIEVEIVPLEHGAERGREDDQALLARRGGSRRRGRGSGCGHINRIVAEAGAIWQCRFVIASAGRDRTSGRTTPRGPGPTAT